MNLVCNDWKDCFLVLRRGMVLIYNLTLDGLFGGMISKLLRYRCGFSNIANVHFEPIWRILSTVLE